MQGYANKLAREALVTSVLGSPTIEPYRPAGLPQPTLSPAITASFPASGSVPDYNDPEPNSYYGYQCGPAAGHNALGAFGINYSIGTGSYPQCNRSDTANAHDVVCRNRSHLYAGGPQR